VPRWLSFGAELTAAPEFSSLSFPTAQRGKWFMQLRKVSDLSLPGAVLKPLQLARRVQSERLEVQTTFQTTSPTSVTE
jgi:hypothetical protein